MADESKDTPVTTLTLEEVNAGYVSKEQMEAIVTQRLARATKGKFSPDELLDNEDFLSRIASERADKLNELLKGGDKVPSADRIRQEILKTQVEPLKSELETERKNTQSLLSRALKGSIQSAASTVGIHDDVVELLEAKYQGKVKYSPEHGDFFLVDDQGEFQFKTGKVEAGAAPYKTVTDELTELKSAGKYQSWFKSTARDGIGLKNTRPGSGKVTLEEFEKMSSNEIGELARSDMETFKELSRQKAEKSAQTFRSHY